MGKGELMFPNEQYRAFILGVADPELEAKIEEELLGGRIDMAYLQQIEEELIDDLLFGQISQQEEHSFRHGYLSTARGAGKLAFARVLRLYAARSVPGRRRRLAPLKLRELMAKRWGLALTGALCCATLWLGERNLSLSRQLAQTAQANNDQRGGIASMTQELEGRAIHPVVSAPPAIQPIIQLSSVNRGLASVPMLHLDRSSTTATVVLELPFDPESSLSEELLNPENKSIWKSQQFSTAAGLSHQGIATIVLPSEIFGTGMCRLQVRIDGGSKTSGTEVTYVFRVLKD